MNIKNLITVATAMMFAAGLLIWSKAGETECIYAIDEKDKMYGVVVSYGNKEFVWIWTGKR